MSAKQRQVQQLRLPAGQNGGRLSGPRAVHGNRRQQRVLVRVRVRVEERRHEERKTGQDDRHTAIPQFRQLRRKQQSRREVEAGHQIAPQEPVRGWNHCRAG